MENNPEQPDRRYIEDLASPEDIQELMAEAGLLLPLGNKTQLAELRRTTSAGDFVLQELQETVNGYEVSTTSLYITRLDDDDPSESNLLELRMYEGIAEPELRPSPSEIGDHIQTAHEVCMELIDTGRLDDVETDIVLYAISYFASYLYEYHPPARLVTTYGGREVSVATAISEVLEMKSTDVRSTLSYTHFNPHARTNLTISQVQVESSPVNAPARRTHYSSMLADLIDRSSGQHITLQFFEDGAAIVYEDTAYRSYQESAPELFHIEKLRAAITDAMEHIEMLPAEEQTHNTETQPNRNWQELLQLALDTDSDYQAIPDTSSEAKAQAKEIADEAMQTLRDTFEKTYHLAPNPSGTSGLSLEIDAAAVAQGIPTFSHLRNVLDLCVPQIFVGIQQDKDLHFVSKDIDENSSMPLEYMGLSWMDVIVSGLPERQVGIAGMVYIDGKKYLCGVPLTIYPNPVYNYTPINN